VASLFAVGIDFLRHGPDSSFGLLDVELAENQAVDARFVCGVEKVLDRRQIGILALVLLRVIIFKLPVLRRIQFFNSRHGVVQ